MFVKSDVLESMGICCVIDNLRFSKVSCNCAFQNYNVVNATGNYVIKMPLLVLFISVRKECAS